MAYSRVRAVEQDRRGVYEVCASSLPDPQTYGKRLANPISRIWAHISEVAGGWAHLARLYLEDQLAGNLGLATAGTAVEVGSQPVMVFATLSNVFADGDGHAKLWNSKGACALKPCVKHTNVLRKAVGVAQMAATSHRCPPTSGTVISMCHSALRHSRCRLCQGAGTAALLALGLEVSAMCAKTGERFGTPPTWLLRGDVLRRRPLPQVHAF